MDLQKKTSKKLSKLFCRNFKHCAILFNSDNKKHKYLFVQVAKDGIKIIPLGNKEIKLLESNGWIFIKIQNDFNTQNKFKFPKLLTCVGFVKQTLKINNPFIWTPDGLYKYLKNRCN